MYLTFHRFYRLRIVAAIIILILALMYLSGHEKIGLSGFAVITLIAVFVCNKLRLGTMPAVCDLCGRQGTMKAEYGAAFSNARLVLTCLGCGRVVNTSKQGLVLKKDDH